MSEDQILAVLPVFIIVVIAVSLFLAIRIIRKTNARTDAPPVSPAPGTIEFPVRQLWRRGFLNGSKNGISPEFAVTSGGIRFKVFRETLWTWSEIKEVHAPWSPFSTLVMFRGTGLGQSLEVSVGDEAKGRAILAALPAGVRLTPRAMALRDGTR